MRPIVLSVQAHGMSLKRPMSKLSDGFWFNEKVPCGVFVIEGGKMDFKKLIVLDYPDIGWDMPVPFKFGKFGPARREIVEATGATDYNFKLELFGMPYYPESYGVINENGTEITFWGGSDSLEVLRWVSPEQLEILREGRDHKDNAR